MQKRLNGAVITSILGVLAEQRKNTLSALPYEAPGPVASSSSSGGVGGLYRQAAAAPGDTEASHRELVRDVVLEAAELATATAAPRAEIGSALEGRRLKGLDVSGARLTADFNRADLSHASFMGCVVANSTFNLSDAARMCVAGAQFHTCTFFGTAAPQVEARGARFAHCIFRQADLRDWDVRGATFFRCTFTLCDLSGWRYDAETRVVDPVDWRRCRREGWSASKGAAVHACCVTGPAANALSLPPAEEWPARRVR